MIIGVLALAGCAGLQGPWQRGDRGDEAALADSTSCDPGTFCNPILAEITAGTWTHSGDTRDGAKTVDSYGCAPSTREGGGEVVYRIELVRAGHLTASLNEVNGDGVDNDVHLLSGEDPANDCIDRGHIDVEADLGPGTYWLVVDAWTDSRGRDAEGPYTVTVGFEPAPQWRPPVGATWHWQLAGTVDSEVDADVAVVDLYAPDSALDQSRAKVACTFSAGTAEDWRDDTGQFPYDAVGQPTSALGVYWLDTRSAGVRDVIAARLDHAVARGCDAVVPRDLNGNTAYTGFGLTTEDARAYTLWLAQAAHDRGLSFGLFDVPDFAPSVLAATDFAVAVDCVERGTCSAFRPFVEAGQAVLHAELYSSQEWAESALDGVCDDAVRERFSTILKTEDLSAWQQACPRADLYSALSALTSSCSRLPGTSDFRKDAGATRNVPVCELDGAIWWTADFDIDCDGGQQSSCTSDPYYQSTTATVDSNGDYLDANTLPFVVMPIESNGFDWRDHGLYFGSVVAVLYDGQIQFAVIGDVGPRGVIGEGSYALAEALGINPHPIAGGVPGGVTYIHFTGTDADVNPIEDTVRAFDLGTQQAWQLVSDN